MYDRERPGLRQSNPDELVQDLKAKSVPQLTLKEQFDTAFEKMEVAIVRLSMLSTKIEDFTAQLTHKLF